MPTLELGAGGSTWADIRIDNRAESNPTHCVDLEHGILPISDNVITEVHAYHVLEHIHNLVPLMKDIFRVCVEGALIDIAVPYYLWTGSFNDPSHVRFFSEGSWEHYNSPELLQRLQIDTGWLDNIEIEVDDYKVQMRVKAIVRKGKRWA